MPPLKKRLTKLQSDFDSAFTSLDIATKLTIATKLESETNNPEIWHQPDNACAKINELNQLNNLIQPWQTMKIQLADLHELLEIADLGLESEIADQLTAIETNFLELKQLLRFTGPHDEGDAILRLTSGVGGLDAQDFTEMLERMYLRWAEKNDVKTATLERQKSDEAGIKTSVIEFKAPHAYGRLKSENGVHRLVRLSPFNSDNLRQTSFALVEVLPKITLNQIQIDPKDLKIDVYRAGGHGGQSVNTTDSAVRITHIPTQITVAIQNERSQLQNKETAMNILAAKLTQLQHEQHVASLAELRAGKSADWGSQIRNYVLHPYTLVKDTRTKYEERDTQSVLDGKIDGFISAYLDANLN